MPSLVTEELLDAISQVESGGNPHARGDLSLSNAAYGAFQVRLPAYRDVQRVFPSEFSRVPFERVQAEPSLNRLVARRYLEAGEHTYGITELPRLIAFCNAGPTVRRGEVPNMSYVRKVLRLLNGR